LIRNLHCSDRVAEIEEENAWVEKKFTHPDNIFANYFDIKNNIINFGVLINQRSEIKYKELHKILRNAGMIELGEQRAGHPLWLNPQTGEKFTTSNHGSHEVARGTLKSILRSAGLENKI